MGRVEINTSLSYLSSSFIIILDIEHRMSTIAEFQFNTRSKENPTSSSTTSLSAKTMGTSSGLKSICRLRPSFMWETPNQYCGNVSDSNFLALTTKTATSPLISMRSLCTHFHVHNREKLMDTLASHTPLTEKWGEIKGWNFWDYLIMFSWIEAI